MTFERIDFFLRRRRQTVRADLVNFILKIEWEILQDGRRKLFLKFSIDFCRRFYVEKKESKNCVQQSPVERPKCATPDTHILIVTFATREKKFSQTISTQLVFPIEELLLLQCWGVKKVVIKNPLHENNQTIFISTQTECLFHPPLSWLLNDSLNF